MRASEFIPLPRVNEATDMICIDSLGLPLGIAQERIGFNVAALEKALRWADLSHITFRAREYPPKPKDRLTVTWLSDEAIPFDWVGTNALYRKHTAITEINATEKDRRIESHGGRWPRQHYEPAAQAHYINKALRQGLKDAELMNHGNLDNYRLMRLWYSGIATGSISLYMAGAPLSGLITSGLLPTLNLLHAAYAKKTAGLPFSDRQRSFFMGVPRDRTLMAHAQATRRLVRVIE